MEWGKMFSFPIPAETSGYSTALIDRLPVALLFFDDENRLIIANQAAVVLLEHPRQEMIGQSMREICPEIALLLDRTPFLQEAHLDLFCQDLLHDQPLRAYLAPIRSNSPRHTRMLLLWADEGANPFVERGEELRIEIPLTNLFESILETIKHGVLVADQQGLVIYHNPTLRALWDMPESVFSESGRGWPILLSRRLKSPERLIRLVHAIQEQPNAEMYDFLEMTGNRILECHSRLQYPVKGAPPVRVWSFEDITEQQRTERELHYLSTHDGLTGLFNRAYFELQLRQLYTYPAYPVSMIMVDVDGLKKINDRYGHPAGDNLLCHTADVLRKACRTDDVVARLGGDEFGILLQRASNDISEKVIERIVHLQTLQRIDHPDLPLSLSVGTATANNNGELTNLFSRADAEMYRIRRRRRAAKPIPRVYMRKGR
jgi:diguanylate cyclase (GGDEF)-like protein